MIWLTPVIAMAATSAPTQREFVIVQRMTFQSAAAEIAIKRQYSTKLNAAYVRIKGQDDEVRRLEALVRGGGPQAVAARAKAKALEAQLATQKADFLAALAAKDSEFARERDRFAAATARVFATPDGEKALELFLLNTSDAARQAINLLNLAADREIIMDTRATSVRNAARRRDIAVQVLNARNNGNLTTADATTAWERVVDSGAGEHWDWIELSRLYQSQSRLDDAVRAADNATKFARDNRDLSTALDQAGDVLLANSDRMGALARYQRALKLSETIALKDPNWRLAQRDWCISLQKIGDLLLSVNDLVGARAHYEQALTLSERLAKQNPDSVEDQSTWALSIEKIRDVLDQESNIDALATYLRAFLIYDGLAKTHISSLKAKRDFAVSSNRIGDVYRKRHEFETALGYYIKSLNIAEYIENVDPNNFDSIYDLHSSLIRVGDVEFLTKKNESAHSRYVRALGPRLITTT